MNSIKRYRQDARVDVDPLDSNSTVHVIRSHRRPFSFTHNIRLSAVITLIIALVATPLTTAVSNPGTKTRVQTYSAPNVAPMTFPAPPYVPPTPPVDNPPTVDTGGNARASRDVVRKPEATPSRVETAVRFALAQQGDPYRWARSGPNAYDCSGLVLRAFAQIGIKLPHYTGTMIGYGKRVSRVGLQRGDIVFPTAGHVGIYLGNNQMVHASSSKGKVVVAKVYSFYAARRLA